MASHKSAKYKQINVIIVGCGTKLAQALLLYYVRETTPADHDPSPWTLDHFLFENQQHILSTKTGKKRQRKFFPGFGKTTKLEHWDLQMYCFVLTEICPLQYEVRQDINCLKAIRNKLCHISQPVISDTTYTTDIERVKGVVSRCTRLMQDRNLEDEMNQYIEDVESGTVDQPDAEKQLREWYDLGKELREILSNLIPAHEDVLQKLGTLLQRSPIDMQQALTIPESDVEIIVKNCTREKENQLSDLLEQLFFEYLDKDSKVESELSDDVLAAIREALRKAMAGLLVGERTLTKVERSSLILKIQCQSFDSLRELFENCGSLRNSFKALEKEIRKLDGLEEAKLEVVIFEETFWRCVTELVTAYERIAEEHASLEDDETSSTLARELSKVKIRGEIMEVRLDDSKEKSSVHLKIKSDSPQHSLHLKESFSNGTAEEGMKQIQDALMKGLNLPKLTLEAKLSESLPKGSSSRAPGSKEEMRLVIAIDFGTTYSGYAYQTFEDFKSGTLNISTVNWSKGSSVISYKTPSCILFNNNMEFDSFGKEAEDKYNDLAIECDHTNWFFFKHFKMFLYKTKELSRTTVLEDVNGAAMPALDVFTASIRYLKDHALRTVSKHVIETCSIHWVITVPAIWNDAAKQFMREAAIKAEIPTDDLTLSLEPEAASLFCRRVPVTKIGDTGAAELKGLHTGDKYMVLDAGGGTVDITVHQIGPENKLQELKKANGGEWGGGKVNEKFSSFLDEMIGKDVMDAVKQHHRADYLDMMQNFEIFKRNVSESLSGTQKFQIPFCIRKTYKQLHSEDLEKGSSVPAHYKDNVKFTSSKMLVEADVVKTFFTEVCEKICEFASKVLQSVSEKGVNNIVMVGAFSESTMLQDKIRSRFEQPNFRIIIPEEPGLAVLKGAVLFGHNPNMVLSRVCKYTYGIRSYKQFESAIDPPEKRVVLNDIVLCKDFFSKHATIGQEFLTDEQATSEEYFPDSAESTSLTLEIFTSVRKHPIYTDEEGSCQIGEMKVHLSDEKSGIHRPVIVSFIFGDTELKVMAVEKHTGQKTIAEFNFL